MRLDGVASVLTRADAAAAAGQWPQADELYDEALRLLPPDRVPEIRRVRLERANAQYYMTWLMRLEGYAREDWEPEIEAARQNFSLLAEQAEAKGDAAAAKKHEEDL